MRRATENDLRRWEVLARETGNSAEGGRIIRSGACDLVTCTDGLYLKFLTPLPAAMLKEACLEPWKITMFDRSPEGEILLPISGFDVLFKALSKDPSAPPISREVAKTILADLSSGDLTEVCLPVETDTIEYEVMWEDGHSSISEALPPELMIPIALAEESEAVALEGLLREPNARIAQTPEGPCLIW